MIAWHVGMLFLTAAEIIWIYVSCCGKFQKTQQLNITMTICAKIACKYIVFIKMIQSWCCMVNLLQVLHLIL